MSETKNVVIQQNNGTNYDILYPDSNSWKKDEVAILETFQKYGLDANAIPKDLFDYLISQIKSEYRKTYLWNRWKWNLNIKTNEPDPDDIIYTDIPDYEYVYIAQFSSVQVVRDGTYVGTPVQIFCKGRADFFHFPPRYYYSSAFKTRQEAENAPPVWYGGYFTEGGVDYGAGMIGYQGDNLTLGSVVLLSNRTTKTDESMVSSSNPNTYSEMDLPDTQGYFYQKDGYTSSPVLGQVYNSYYMGTGTYDSSNENIINCSGNPIMVTIIEHNKSANSNIGNLPVNFINSSNYTRINSNNIINVKWGDKSLSWYTGSATAQLNEKGVRYDFVVIQTI